MKKTFTYVMTSLLMIGFGFLTTGTFTSEAHAVTVDVSTIFTNIGFENGNLSAWTLTQPNANYVATLSPPVNPVIDPGDAAHISTTLVAPAGQYFTGVKRPGDAGPDLAFKLAHDAYTIPVSFATGTDFSVTVFANKGRLEPFFDPASTAELSVRIFGWTAGSLPTVTAATDNWSRSISWNPAAQSFNFASVLDGTWGQQTFTFNPSSLGFDAATLKYLTVSITGQTHNHDQYIATDVGSASAVPEPSSMLLLGTGLAGLVAWRLRKKIA